MQFLQAENTKSHSLGTRILRFNRETKQTKTVEKIIEKFIVSFIVTVISLFFTVRQLGGGGDRTIAPSLNTPLDIAPPRTYCPRTVPCGQFPLPFTRCRTFLPVSYDHPPIYKIDRSRSVREYWVRSTG